MAKTKWFVTPETVRLYIGDGEWLEVKKRLTIGELRKSTAAVIKEIRGDGRVTPDIEMVGKAEVLAYLVDWSLRDEQNKSVRIDTEARKVAAIDSLDPDCFKVINEAITAHVDAMAAERAAEKNAQAGENASSGTSPSAV